jgi:hypothetical protein
MKNKDKLGIHQFRHRVLPNQETNIRKPPLGDPLYNNQYDYLPPNDGVSVSNTKPVSNPKKDVFILNGIEYYYRLVCFYFELNNGNFYNHTKDTLLLGDLTIDNSSTATQTQIYWLLNEAQQQLFKLVKSANEYTVHESHLFHTIRYDSGGENPKFHFLGYELKKVSK